MRKGRQPEKGEQRLVIYFFWIEFHGYNIVTINLQGTRNFSIYINYSGGRDIDQVENIVTQGMKN